MRVSQSTSRVSPNGGPAPSHDSRHKSAGNRHRGERKSRSDDAKENCLFVEQLSWHLYNMAPSPATLGNLRHLVSDGSTDLPSINPSDYHDSAVFAIDYQAVSLLKKFEGFKRYDDRYKEQAALAKWKQAEMQCFGTNCSWRSGGHLGHSTSVGTTGTIFNRMRQLIAGVLGEVTAETYQLIGMGSDHGSGGTTRVRRSEATFASKFSGAPEASAAIFPWIQAWKNQLGITWPTVVKTVNSSKMAFVPKNSKIFRPIASEPDFNILFQKGVGSLFKRFMLRRAFLHKNKVDIRKYGLTKPTIDLSDQQPNQVASRWGSIHGSLATVDLSMASDCLSYEVVRALLPEDWFDILNRFRTSSTRLKNGKPILLEKFSAMGNGFTFELESLIFWAAARAICDLGGSEHPVLVFGDDIVIDAKYVLNGDLELVLAALGFTLNAEKSFSSGPFRESCGKHYFHGDDVTPFYVREDVQSIDQQILFLNNLRRWNCAWGTSGCRETSMRDLRVLLAAEIRTPALRYPRIADGYGDGALIGTLEEINPVHCSKLHRNHPFHQWEGWRCVTTLPVFTAEKHPLAQYSGESSVDEETPTLHREDVHGPLLAGLWLLKGRESSNWESRLAARNYQFVGGSSGTAEKGRKPVRVGYRQQSIVCRDRKSVV